MQLDPDTCYQTLLARDRRFDGWFFVGVASTGIYCRPVCPVRTPRRENCHFFTSAAAAERAGFRPCLRCRPELAPGNGLLDVSSRLARAAATLIEEGFLNAASVAQLATRIGVTDRHLRRIFEAEFGVSMIEFAQTHRLLMAKRLLTDTQLPVSTIALAAGFGSVRRFNDLFLQRYDLNPLRFRKGLDGEQAGPGQMTFALGYRPPFCWPGMLAFLAHRHIRGVEHIDEDTYTRTFALSHDGRDCRGWVQVRHAPQRYALDVTVPPSLTPVIAQVLARVRRLFDLASRPDLIDLHLGALAAASPGLRVPGTLDGFEVAVQAIVAQHVGLPHTRTTLARLAARFGTPTTAPCGLTTTFPSAAVCAALPASTFREVGIGGERAAAIVAVAHAVASGRLTLEPAAPLEATLSTLRDIRGIGEWAVQYIAMRSLGWPNALPAGDAVLKRQFGCASAAELDRHAQRWQPWRAYATVHVWHRYETSPP